MEGGQRTSDRSCGLHPLRGCRWRCRNMHPESKCGFRASATRRERSIPRFGRRGLTHGQQSEFIWSVGSAGLPEPSRRRKEIEGDKHDCEACGGEESFGPGRYWLRPPGFAHPVDLEEVTSPDDMPETSYATRAKLTMGTPDEVGWVERNQRTRTRADGSTTPFGIKHWAEERWLHVLHELRQNRIYA